MRKSWWQRNKVAVLVVVGMSTLMCAGVWALFGMLGSSDAAVMGLRAARADARVSERLGEPIALGWHTMGSIRVNGGGTGYASLSLPLSGPRGSGTLYVVADREAGEWHVRKLVLRTDDGARVDLQPASPAQATANSPSDDD